MEIDKEELKNIMNSILDRFLFSIGEKINLSNDYFWDIPSSEVFQLDNQPYDLGIAQLSEDFNNLKKAYHSKRDYTGYELILLSRIVRIIGEENFKNGF